MERWQGEGVRLQRRPVLEAGREGCGSLALQVSPLIENADLVAEVLLVLVVGCSTPSRTHQLPPTPPPPPALWRLKA